MADLRALARFGRYRQEAGVDEVWFGISVDELSSKPEAISPTSDEVWLADSVELRITTPSGADHVLAVSCDGRITAFQNGQKIPQPGFRAKASVRRRGYSLELLAPTEELMASASDRNVGSNWALGISVNRPRQNPAATWTPLLSFDIASAPKKVLVMGGKASLDVGATGILNTLRGATTLPADLGSLQSVTLWADGSDRLDAPAGYQLSPTMRMSWVGPSGVRFEPELGRGDAIARPRAALPLGDDGSWPVLYRIKVAPQGPGIIAWGIDVRTQHDWSRARAPSESEVVVGSTAVRMRSGYCVALYHETARGLHAFEISRYGRDGKSDDGSVAVLYRSSVNEIDLPLGKGQDFEMAVLLQNRDPEVLIGLYVNSKLVAGACDAGPDRYRNGKSVAIHLHEKNQRIADQSTLTIRSLQVERVVMPAADGDSAATRSGRARARTDLPVRRHCQD